jgi:hypothetical protein
MHARQPATHDLDHARVDVTSMMWPAHTGEPTRVQQGEAAPGYISRSKTGVLAHEIRQDLKFRDVE